MVAPDPSRQSALLVLESGTCLTATLGLRDGGIRGGAILPGLTLGMRALAAATAWGADANTEAPESSVLVKNVSIFNGKDGTLIKSKDLVIKGTTIEKLIPAAHSETQGRAGWPLPGAGRCARARDPPGRAATLRVNPSTENSDASV